MPSLSLASLTPSRPPSALARESDTGQVETQKSPASSAGRGRRGGLTSLGEVEVFLEEERHEAEEGDEAAQQGDGDVEVCQLERHRPDAVFVVSHPGSTRR